MALGRFGYDFGPTCGEDLPASISAFRAEIDDPVCRADDVKIVFNDDYGITSI